jgi:protein phosphatase
VIGYDKIEHASLTDVGIRRSHNQDCHGVLLASDTAHWQEQGHIYLVADGMGAHAVGEMASELAVKIILHTYHKHAREGPAAALRKAFIEANASIHARGQQNREFEGMGTTGTALLLRPEGAWVGHVGDSRAYRVRGDQIEQLSFDHSLVWELARRQKVDPDGLQGIPSNVIVRSLGPEPLVEVDVEGPHPLQPGDLFIVCSDGLSGPLSDHEIGAAARVLPPAEACQFLVDLTNLRGGPDNITIVIVRIGGEPAPNPATADRKWRIWRQPVSWEISALALGVLLAAGAVASVFANLPTLGSVTFGLAALTLVAGLVGLWIHLRQEGQRRAQKTERPRLKIHRHSPCDIEPPLLHKLAKAEAHLAQWARERQWEADWAVYQQHHQLAEGLLGQGDLEGAFREYCRAMRPLTEAVQRQRSKEEVFQPIWDKGER